MTEYWLEDFHAESSRNSLILQYIGSGAGSGNQDFRRRVNEMAREFSPTMITPTISGPIDTADMMLFLNPEPERAVQGARMLIMKAHEYHTIYRGLRNNKSPGATELTKFVTKIEDLARSFGLCPAADADDWWGYSYLHYLISHEMHALAQLGYSALERGFLTLRPYSSYGYYKQYTINWERVEESHKEKAESYILQQFRKQWDESNKELKKRGFSPISRRYLDVHIHWLYCRICPQPPFGRPWGWAYLAQQEYCSVRECSRVVKALAKALEIALPVLPAGRPPKYNGIV